MDTSTNTPAEVTSYVQRVADGKRVQDMDALLADLARAVRFASGVSSLDLDELDSDLVELIVRAHLDGASTADRVAVVHHVLLPEMGDDDDAVRRLIRAQWQRRRATPEVHALPLATEQGRVDMTPEVYDEAVWSALDADKVATADHYTARDLFTLAVVA